MEKGKRRKLLNLVKNKLISKAFFGFVHLRFPERAVPDALNLPGVFMYRSAENLSRLTNAEKRSAFGIEFIVYVHSSTDLELVKADAEDELEEAIIELQTDSAFSDLSGVEIKVTGSDSSPLALASLGISEAVAPPFGAVRIVSEIVFDYQAID